MCLLLSSLAMFPLNQTKRFGARGVSAAGAAPGERPVGLRTGDVHRADGLCPWRPSHR